MNEMDLKTKIEGLEKAIKEHKDFMHTYESTLKTTQQELEDYNKPEITPLMMDNIFEAIESAVDSYDFSDTDNFDIEYGIEYDGKVYCESHDFRNSDDLAQMILEKVSRVFTEMECPEDELDTTEADNHKPVE